MKKFFPVEILATEPYSFIIGYPSATKRQIQSRVVELKKLGVDGVSFQGPILIGKIPVLGKGYTGVVILAKRNGKKVALKIRRTDSPRKTMKDESILLKKANSVKVGPLLIDSSNNFLIMQYLNGKKIYDWINHLEKKNNVDRLKGLIRKILQDCYRLDKLGLDHGELSNITKHVIVGRSATIIDFESASLKRKVSNVTSATQAILIGSGIAKITRSFYRLPIKNTIIKVLREYKATQTQESFDKVLEVLRLGKGN